MSQSVHVGRDKHILCCGQASRYYFHSISTISDVVNQKFQFQRKIHKLTFPSYPQRCFYGMFYSNGSFVYQTHIYIVESIHILFLSYLFQNTFSDKLQSCYVSLSIVLYVQNYIEKYRSIKHGDKLKSKKQQLEHVENIQGHVTTSEQQEVYTR